VIGHDLNADDVNADDNITQHTLKEISQMKNSILIDNMQQFEKVESAKMRKATF